ncbi:hypothetical protein GN157_15145 [Flavobacterium rakeshii]|uniref:Uncharacterized protein n=1 Tax=Flavobacterium rakeshii TaxID=1038845 RepID=A0A6N8HH37_9FLAO|nr:hypothetical protein [Flavobacterium rakeshii]MUV05052.1 hypothetical protein [Flavobacterium rakeshii]
MSKNEIASTLFKFISLRNPQLPDPEDIKVKFSQQDEQLQTGVFFDTVLNRPEGQSKGEALANAAAKLTTILNENDVKGLSTNLYDFSEWVVRNKSSYADDELTSKVKALTALTEADEQKLWDNLFYQVVTAKSFNDKEAVMKMLLGQHIVSGFKESDKELNKKLVNARIVLPAVLFSDDTVKEEEVPDRPDVIEEAPDSHMTKKMAANKAKYDAQKIETFKNELDVIEADYRRRYDESYKAARESYEETIAPTMDTYYADLKAAQAQSCSVRQSEAYDPNDPCQQPEVVPFPKLPEFKFSFEREIDFPLLVQKLSYGSYGCLMEALSGDEAFELPDNSGTPTIAATTAPISVLISDTFDGLKKQLNPLLSKKLNTLKENLVVKPPKLSIGGTLIDTTIGKTSVDEGNFKVYGFRSGYTFTYSIWAGLAPKEEVVKAVINGYDGRPVKTITKLSPKTSRNGVTVELENLFDFTFEGGSVSSPPKFDIELHLNNGNIKYINNIKSLLDKVAVSGTLVSSNGPSNQTIPVSKPFTASGFGFRQIGIADYLRVEQSVQCYVEGEVSHIENVMARAYREKSTRRLVRTEDTTSTSSETEKETLTDTSTADRYELHSEVAKVIQESKDVSGSTNSGYRNGATSFYVDAGVGFANSSSQENSNSIAVTQAKEVTERALDRVVAKVKEERIRKVIEEYEENNKHGFDNRRGNEHVVGVYRWVDKLYKNQVFNYGRRLMFEFMIPDPAKLHILGMKEEAESNNGTLLTEPVNPVTFTDSDLRIGSAGVLTEAKANYWAAVYNVELEPYPQQYKTVGKSLAYGKDLANPKDQTSGVGLKDDIELPEGYETVSWTASANGKTEAHASVRIGVGGTVYTNNSPTLSYINKPLTGFVESLPISVSADRYWSFNMQVSVKCQPTTDYINTWKQISFKAIMDAYNEALAQYQDAIAQEKAKEVTTKQTNPGFFRDIENLVLRKNCIAYLLNETSGANNTYGKNMGNSAQNSFSDYEVALNANLTAYGNFAKFMEQAFEWDIMSYNFYPYYWAPKDSWKQKYQFDETSDPVFRSFIQAGMARVIVTVRPGFEEAVYHFIKTGAIWNGGQVPVIGDDNYMGVVDEVRTIPAEPVGKAWITRVPTDLTILQAGSIGLKVDKALPCDCSGIDDFENPEAIPCDSNFEITNTVMEQNALSGDTDTTQPGQKITFTIKGIDNFQGVEDYVISNYQLPMLFNCGDTTVTVENQGWDEQESSEPLYQHLAQQLSLVPGVTVTQFTENSRPDNLRFTIDSAKHQLFVFDNIVPMDETKANIKLAITTENLTVTEVRDPYKVYDAQNVQLTIDDIYVPLNINRFLS